MAIGEFEGFNVGSSGVELGEREELEIAIPPVEVEFPDVLAPRYIYGCIYVYLLV